jgi:hypothetical protein
VTVILKTERLFREFCPRPKGNSHVWGAWLAVDRSGDGGTSGRVTRMTFANGLGDLWHFLMCQRCCNSHIILMSLDILIQWPKRRFLWCGTRRMQASHVEGGSSSSSMLCACEGPSQNPGSRVVSVQAGFTSVDLTRKKPETSFDPIAFTSRRICCFAGNAPDNAM